MLQKLINELRAIPKFIHILAAITVFGLSVGVYRMYAGLGATTNLNKEYPWGFWISFDLSMIALAGGAFTLAALVYIFQFESLHAAVRPTLLAGLLGYGSVFVILLFDLGRWDRFYNVFIHPNPTSALLAVAWCLAAYSLVLLYEFSPVVLAKTRWKWLLPTIKKYLIPIVIGGVTLSTLHEVLLGDMFVIMSPRLHPLWHSMLLPVFFLINSLPAGIAMVIAGATVSYWLFGRSLKKKTIATLGWFLPWILGFYVVLKIGELMVTDETNMLWHSGRYSVLFWAELVIGAIIPTLLFAFRQVREGRALSMIGAFLILGGTILNWFNITWFAIRPVNGQMYTPHWMEVAPAVGVVAGVIAVYSLVARYFPVYEETVAYRKPSLKSIPVEEEVFAANA